MQARQTQTVEHGVVHAVGEVVGAEIVHTCLAGGMNALLQTLHQIFSRPRMTRRHGNKGYHIAFKVGALVKLGKRVYI